jgi:lysophospholipid acyltransferase (LPLAT)-like uncharacterized protein
MRVLDQIALTVLPRIAYVLIKIIGMTQRITYVGLGRARDVLRQHGSGIIAFWHNRILGTTYNYFRLFGDKQIVALISRSRDGEYATRIQEVFGTIPVRGSSNRVNVDAVKKIVREIKAGKNCAITPDGPRGPRYSVQNGALVIATLANAPIIPVCYDCTKKRVLNSWDQFIVPLPFGKMVFVFGNPIFTRDGSRKIAVDQLRVVLKDELDRITAYAEQRIADMKGGKRNRRRQDGK